MPLGTVTTRVGFQLSDVVPALTPIEALNAVMDVDRTNASADVAWPGVVVRNVPDVAVAGPDQYLIELVGMVWSDPPVPVVKLVLDTVAVHVRVPDRVSETVMVPSCAEKVVPLAPDCVPKTAFDGTVMPRPLTRGLRVK